MGHIFFVTNISLSIRPSFALDQLQSMQSLITSELTKRTDHQNDGYVSITIMNALGQVLPTLQFWCFLNRVNR